MIDILGHEIHVGDIVAHGQRSGNSGCITIKLVTETRESDNSWYSDKGFGEVKVIGYTYLDHDWNKETREWEPVEPHYELNSRGGWTTSDVLIVINDSVPNELKQFLTSCL